MSEVDAISPLTSSLPVYKVEEPGRLVTSSLAVEPAKTPLANTSTFALGQTTTSMLPTGAELLAETEKAMLSGAVEASSTAGAAESATGMSATSLQNTMWQLFLRAQNALYSTGNYQDAEKYFNLFFHYQHLYGAQFPEAFWNLHQVLFQYALTKELLTKPKEADLVMNASLAEYLNHLEDVRSITTTKALHDVADLQRLGELPSEGHLFREVDPNTLIRLATTFERAGELSVAANLLKHLEVRQLFDLFRTEIQIQQLMGKSMGDVLASLKPLTEKLSMFDSHGLAERAKTERVGQWGLPWAPVFPALSEVYARNHAPEVNLDPNEIRTDKVNPIRRLKKDPNADDQRKRRQQAEHRKVIITLPDAYEHIVHPDKPDEVEMSEAGELTRPGHLDVID